MGCAIGHWLRSASLLGLTALALVAQPALMIKAADKPADPLPAKQQQPADQPDVWLGVQCVTLDESLRSQLDLKSDEGLLVRDVAPDSPAASAGLERNDVLLSAGGKRLATIADLQHAVSGAKQDELKLELLRAGKPKMISVKPQPRPDLSGHGVAKLPPRQREALRQWIDQLHRGDGQFPPMAMRFFHPGILLPQGAGGDLQLPDDASVTIFRQGKSPAKVTVRQGDETWEVTEEDLSELPDHLRPAVEAMLPMAPGRAISLPKPKTDEANPGPEEAIRKSINEQLDQMNQRLEALERLNRLDSR